MMGQAIPRVGSVSGGGGGGGGRGEAEKSTPTLSTTRDDLESKLSRAISQYGYGSKTVQEIQKSLSVMK
jgi:hypothetical protein